MSRPRYHGRLELTWTNKDQCLLSHEDGTYEWVAPTDYRVAEVRLLHDAGKVGETHPDKERAKDNLLIRGDALHALTSLVELPEFAREYVGKVKLCYIDPPFNTGQAFEQYDDALEHSVWLTMMRDRLIQIRRLLSNEGSLWLHLDDVEAHRARCVLDEIFGAGNFVANIIWEKSYTRENRTDISTTHDNILVYAKDKTVWKQVRNLLPPTAEQRARYSNPDNDPRGPWKSTPAHAKADPGRRASQFYTITTPSGRKVTPPPGRCWLFTENRFQELLKDNRIWFGVNGDAVPSVKKFLSEVQAGLVPVTIWLHKEVGTTSDAKQEVLAVVPSASPFATPKPERLMERIIHIATDPGDIVLDCFAGSGTTAAVAHKMGRRWVTVEWSRETVETYALPRLKKVVAGEDDGGISTSTEITADQPLPGRVSAREASEFHRLLGKFAGQLELADQEEEQVAQKVIRQLRDAARTREQTTIRWEGGGGFRVLDVAPSMFEEADGFISLAEWMTNGKLAEATAAQLGFEFEADGVFCGRKGRTRLAVIDGLINESVVELITNALAEDERVIIAGTAIDPQAEDRVRDLRPGSRLRKIPQSILTTYQQQHRWRPATVNG